MSKIIPVTKKNRFLNVKRSACEKVTKVREITHELYILFVKSFKKYIYFIIDTSKILKIMF